MSWIEYDFYKVDTRPPTPGRYLIYRKGCNKMHFEQWNGSGWASRTTNNDCTHWCLPEPPKNMSEESPFKGYEVRRFSCVFAENNEGEETSFIEVNFKGMDHEIELEGHDLDKAIEYIKWKIKRHE